MRRTGISLIVGMAIIVIVACVLIGVLIGAVIVASM